MKQEIKKLEESLEKEKKISAEWEKKYVELNDKVEKWQTKHPILHLVGITSTATGASSTVIILVVVWAIKTGKVDLTRILPIKSTIIENMAAPETE